MSPGAWLVVFACGALGLAALFVACLPWIVQPLFRLLLAPRYRLRIEGLHHVPPTGPVLFAANHVTWLDGFLLAAAAPRRGRMLINAAYVRRPVLRSLARRAGLIPVPFDGPHSLHSAVRAARAALDRGEAVALFPEGQITRNGLLGPFQRGLEVILKNREHVPVVPVALDNLWGSAFSFANGGFLRFRAPRRVQRRTVAIVFGPPVAPPVTRFAVRQAVLQAGVQAAALRTDRRRPSDLETVDRSRPHLDHPELGPLTGSTADFHSGDVHQLGQRPGSVGLPLPGVALRIVDAQGRELPPETAGTLEALVVGRPGWVDTHWRGWLDREGFLFPAPDAAPAQTTARS